MNSHHLRFNFVFPRNYEAKVVESYGLVNPVEKLHHFPAMLDEGDRSGIYVRVVPQKANSWVGFFALGFESRSEEHTSELQSPCNLVCRLLLEKKKKNAKQIHYPIVRSRCFICLLRDSLPSLYRITHDNNTSMLASTTNCLFQISIGYIPPPSS